MEIVFKKATKKDLKGIIELCNECFEENTNYEYALKEFKKSKKNKNDIYLIGVINNEIVAHSKITVIQTIYEGMGTYSILNHVCVKNDLRRKGIATKLLKECENVSRECGCKNMELWSKNFRQAAHACYKKYGFELLEAGFFTKKI